MLHTHSEKMSKQRREIYQREFDSHVETSQILRMAKSLSAFLREKDLVLWEDDVFAGYEQFYDYSLPEIPLEFADKDPGDSDTEILKKVTLGQRIGLYSGGLGGHVIAGYQKVLEKGFAALAEDAEKKLRTGDPVSRDFAESSLTVCRAASTYALRYAETADMLSRDTDDSRNRTRLLRIGKACRWVALNPPRTFVEAIQLLWLTHEIITCEQRSGSLSLGRLDQYLHPFYEKDLNDGLMAREEAAELVQALWIKFSGMRRGFQHVTLGGGYNGTYAANDLTLLCLQATKSLRLDQPLISVRWRHDMPDNLWNQIQDLIGMGMGFPALFNDKIAIDAKRKLGVAESDAENYGIVGCVEVSIPGKEFSHTEELRVNWAKVLELILNGGRCAVTGERMDLKANKDMASIHSFSEFRDWYKNELLHFLDLGIAGRNIEDRRFPDNLPYPFLSSTMECCLEIGRDVTAGSTVYNFSTVNGCGMSNAANSLAAINQLVFENKQITLPELARMLEEKEVFPRQLISNCRRVGNDQDEPDGILKDLADFFAGGVAQHTNPRGGRFQTGLYTVDAHAHQGKLTGTLPDGRMRCTALASGMSPSQGTDLSGPTSVIKSITKLDHRKLGNGMVLDLKFHPSFFKDDSQVGAFRHLVETYFRLGGMEIQFNVVDRETLRRAQSSPEEYRDLIVRVSGFSAYFTDLSIETQDEIMDRTEHVAV